MPRIRSIKPEFWGDEKLSPLTPIDRLVFLGLISMADDTGRVPDSIRAINGFIFPETEDSAAASLELLTECGRLDRGVTRSGQQVIQIVNWKHQKIDKPNFSSALPAIVILDESSRRRRTMPAKLRDAILERDGWVCQVCGIEVRRDKRDRYDADPDLAEIDHILPVVEGGTEDPENLQALCLGCNRKKAGECVRRRNAADSTTDRRNVDDASAPHINDLRSTINDLGSTISDQRPASEGAAFAASRAPAQGGRFARVREHLPDDHRESLDGLIRTCRSPDALLAELEALANGMRPMHPTPTWAHIGQAMSDLVLNGERPTALLVRAYVQRIVRDEGRRATPDQPQEGEFVRAARLLEAKAAR